MIVYLDYLSSPFFLIVRAINNIFFLDIKCDVGILKTPIIQNSLLHVV